MERNIASRSTHQKISWCAVPGSLIVGRADRYARSAQSLYLHRVSVSCGDEALHGNLKSCGLINNQENKKGQMLAFCWNSLVDRIPLTQEEIKTQMLGKVSLLQTRREKPELDSAYIRLRCLHSLPTPPHSHARPTNHSVMTTDPSRTLIRHIHLC